MKSGREEGEGGGYKGVLVNDASSCLGMSQSVFRLGPYPLKQCLAKVEQNSSIAMNFRGPLCIVMPSRVFPALALYKLYKITKLYKKATIKVGNPVVLHTWEVPFSERKKKQERRKMSVGGERAWQGQWQNECDFDVKREPPPIFLQIPQQILF